MHRRAYDQDEYVRGMEALSERPESHQSMPQAGDLAYCPVDTQRQHFLYRNRDGSIGCHYCGYPPKFIDLNGEVARWSAEAAHERTKQ